MQRVPLNRNVIEENNSHQPRGQVALQVLVAIAQRLDHNVQLIDHVFDVATLVPEALVVCESDVDPSLPDVNQVALEMERRQDLGGPQVFDRGQGGCSCLVQRLTQLRSGSALFDHVCALRKRAAHTFGDATPTGRSSSGLVPDL